MNFEESVRQKRIELEEKEKANLKRLEEEKERRAKKVESNKNDLNKTEIILPKPILEEKGPSEVRMTLDGIRGLYLIASGYGDKKSKKEELEQKLKESLLNPLGFGSFLENLSKYLKSI
jgi:hypothetical protein